MAIQLECPGCKAVLSVDDSLAGKQGKCIHCGHRVIVPGGAAKPPEPVSSTLSEATPEAMMRELAARGQSAVLFLFRPTDEGSYDLADVPDADLKCIATEDINAARFGQLVESISKRFAPRKRGPVVAGPAAEPFLYELKGDRLGMSLDEFKRKYARGEEGSRERLPVCSDEAWGASKAALHVAPWHRQAGIVHARIDQPAEDNSPTVAGVKTELLLYHFVDGQLFRISAFFPTDLFHLVSEAAVTKYGPVTNETQKPRQLVWENVLASVMLTRGTVHPPEPSTLILVYKPLAQIAESRAPRGAGDI
ncbi:MAG: hypothetical protein WD669_10855 [Pirellulales bacterium]